MLYKIFRVSLVLLAWYVMVIPTLAFSGSLYDKNNCIKGYQLGGGDNSKSINVAPINVDCQSSCTVACASFKTLVQTKDINSSIVLACQSACQAGKTFISSYQQLKDPTNPSSMETITAAPLTVASPCQAKDLTTDASIVHTGFSVDEGDQVQMIFTGGDDADTIYLCGQAELTAIPIFSSLDNAQWPRTNTQSQWTDRIQHSCLNNVTDTEWQNLNNKQLWDVTQNISASLTPQSQGKAGLCKWSARNSNFTDTGIYLADGDELSLVWYGDYGNNQQTTITVPNPTSQNSNATKTVTIGENMNRLAIGQCMINLLLSDADSSMSQEERTKRAEFCQQVWRNTSILEVKPAGQDTLDYNENQEPIQLIGEAARQDALGSGLMGSQATSLIMGLKGFAVDIGLEKSVPGGQPCVTNPYDAQCTKIDDLKYVMYMYSGMVDGFSTARTKLAIRHGEAVYNSNNPPAAAWNDNFGGVTAQIRWGGCPFYNGERTQYAVVATGLPQEGDWLDLTPATLAGQPVAIQEKGMLYLRINRLTPPGGLPAEAQALYTDAGNLFGKYVINIEVQTTSNSFIGTLRTLIKNVYDVLLGENGSGGVVRTIYNGAISPNSHYIRFVQVFLVFYITMFALGYLMGTIKANQQEMIVRLVKFSFVVAIISPSSWQFFGVFCVDLFVKGSAELIAVMMEGSLPARYQSSAAISQDPSVVFEMFDIPISQIFSPITGKKLAALFSSGFFGFISILILGFSMVLYALSIIKATLMYMYTLIGISLLLVMTPVMIPFMLFQITKQTFESWWKYLVSFALQPVMIFAVMAILNMVFMALFRLAMDFTICPFCWAAFIWDQKSVDDWIHKKNCSITSWVPLVTAHAPFMDAGMTVPLVAFVTGIALLLVSHLMFRLPGAIAELTTRMVTGAPIRLMTAAQAVDQMSRAGTYARMRLKATGKDVGIAAARTAQRKYYGSDKKKKKEKDDDKD